MITKVFSNDGQSLTAYVNDKNALYISVYSDGEENLAQYIALDDLADIKELIKELKKILSDVENG